MILKGGWISLERLPKQFQPYYERVPQELQKEFDALPLDVLIATLQELDKFHREVEKAAYEVTLGLIRALWHG